MNFVPSDLHSPRVFLVLFSLFSFASCNAAVCDVLPANLNAEPDVQGLQPPFPDGTNLTYKCISGFALHPGASPFVVCIADNETAAWNYDATPLCTRVCSDELPDIPHTTFDTEGKGPPFNPGVEIPFRCDDGYISGGRQLKLKCVVKQENAVWDYGDDESPCNPKSCGFPGDIENAQRSGNIFTFPNSVIYKCNEGYKIKGRTTVFCLASGNWGPSLPSCEAIVCPLLPDPHNGRVISVDRHYNSIATYECDRGYRVKGAGHRVCGSNSQWSDESPVCEVVTCLPPGDLQNGRVIYTKERYQSGDMIIFVCNTGGARRTSKCSETGEWTERPPNCPGPKNMTDGTTPSPTVITTPPTTKVSTNSPGHVNESMCDDPGDIPHSKRTASGFTSGGNVTYTCEDGYDLRGKGTLICLGTGKWNLDKLPICVKPISTTIIVVASIAIILVLAGIIAYFCYRWKRNHTKGYGKKDTDDFEETAELQKEKKPYPVTEL